MLRTILRTSLTLLFVAVMSLPSLGAVAIEDLMIRKKGADVNLRVIVRNPGGTTQRGPISIALYVRRDAGDSWKLVRQWNDVRQLKPYNKVAKDFFEENNALLRQMAAYGHFDVRALVTSPGMVSVERVTPYEWATGQ